MQLAVLAAPVLLAVTTQAKDTTFNDPGFNKIVWVDSPNFGHRAKDTDIDTIVLHHTAGPTLGGTVNWFKDTKSQVSAHFVVGKDGSIVQMVNQFERAWHAGASKDAWGRGDVNSRSIGIEIVNVGDGKDPYTEPQLRALDNLVTVIFHWHHIKQITSHEYVAEPQGRKNDPINFPWERMTHFGVPLFYGLKPKTTS
ncbi:MAG: N-acetylmuramoyl-L-alanine amidase [Armatimonadota bacterium]